MSEENQKSEEMKWDEHLKRGFDGLKDEMKDRLNARDNLKEMKKHGRNAMKEMLLAWRSLLDSAITQLDESAADAKPKRVTKIKIE